MYMFCSYIGLFFYSFYYISPLLITSLCDLFVDTCSLSPETVLTELEHVREERDSLIVQLSRKESEDSLRVSV